MYFVYRAGRYIDVAGRSFRDYMNGKLHAETGAEPTIGDFADHVTTVFTDVRIKRFLEMRGADAGRPDMMLAQSALWVGLLYNQGALDAALEEVGVQMLAAERVAARDDLRARIVDRAAEGLAAQVVEDHFIAGLRIAGDDLHIRGIHPVMTVKEAGAGLDNEGRHGAVNMPR